MSHRFGSGNRRSTLAIASVAALALAGLAGTTSYAAGTSGPSASSPRASHAAGRPRLLRRPHRRRPGRRPRRCAPRNGSSAKPQARAFAKAAPAQLVTDLDGNTGTVRMQTRLDGFLTPASHKSAKSIALGYVRAHLAELGLTSGDMTTFHLGRELPRHHRRPPPLLHPADRRPAGAQQRTDRQRQQARSPADRGRLPHQQDPPHDRADEPGPAAADARGRPRRGAEHDRRRRRHQPATPAPTA